ncbi:Fic family protein [Segatella albensis]|uniref:Fic family protein n=1 Tax=Segatella albensis TaxID=77768 RepID=UPI000487B9C9|nr:Fic family protein [Segatella albensis]
MIEKAPIIDISDNIDTVMNLIHDPNLQTLYKKIEDEYLYWDKVKYLTPKGVDPQLFWGAVKMKRQMQLQTIRFGKYTFSFMITPLMQSLLHEFDLKMGGSLSANGVISPRDRQIYLVNSIMEEAIASSQMEGASTTRKVAKDMLRKELRPKNRSQQMIVNNYATIKQLVEEKGQVLDLNMLLDIHRSITTNTLDNPEDEGRLRQTDDIYVIDAITGSVAHTPPSHTEIEELLHDLFAFASDKDKSNFIHPIIKGIILHFMLAWIHPFVDGNGRTARSLVYWYMLKKDYWMTEYLSISRVIYKNKKRYERMFLYTEADHMNMTYFILHNLQVMKKAYEDLKTYLSMKMEERNSVLQYCDIEGINERQMQILKIINDTPSLVLTSLEVSNRFGISDKTARTDLKVLTELGYLKRIPINKKQSGYIKA